MEYTKNYKLPQWVETDRIRMEDFNQAMADIETGLNSKAEECAMMQMAAAFEENLEKLSAFVGSGGKTCRIAYGTYTGDGTFGSDIPTVFTFDFKPLVMFVARTANEQSTAGSFCVVRGMTISMFNFSYCGELTWTDNGLSISSNSSADNQWNGEREYCYVAIGVNE